MNQSDIQFSVDELRRLPGGDFSVCGRCSKGPIDIGDRFDSILDVLVRKTPEEYATAETRVVGTVNLRVDQILAYGRQFEQLDQGVTAELIVSGTGGDRLKVGHSLGGTGRSRG